MAVQALEQPIYTSRAGGTALVNFLLVVTSLDAVIGLALIIEGTAWETGVIMVAVGVLLPLFIWSIFPRRYEIWARSLRIVFPLWNWDIQYSTVASAEEAKWWQSYAFSGVRLATAPGQAIVVWRRNANIFGRPNVVISPVDRAAFLPQLQRALNPDIGVPVP